MSKLLKLKEWVTIPDAAMHLTQIFNEPFSEADIFQLALDEHITISVMFPNRAHAQIGKVVPFKEVPIRELPSPLSGEPQFFPDGHLLNDLKDGEPLTEETPFIHFNKAVTSIDGIWDLSMTGGERIDIEFELHRLIGGPEVTMMNLNGTFLNRKDGTWASLQSKFKDRFELQADGKKKRFPGHFYPAGGLGDDCKLVVRTSELLRFHAAQEEEPLDRPILTRERETLLNIIWVMLELLQTPKPGRTSDAAVIQEMLDNYGEKPGIKERTLQEKFPAAKRSLLGK